MELLLVGAKVEFKKGIIFPFSKTAQNENGFSIKRDLKT